MISDQKQNISNWMTSKTGAAFILLFLALAYLVTMSFLKEETYRSRSVEADIIDFLDLQDGTEIKATIENDRGLFPLSYKENTLFLPPTVTGLFSVPYTITATLQSLKGSYIDIKWTLDEKGVLYTNTIKGLKSSAHIDVKIDDTLTMSSIKPDWSGKIEFQSFLNPNKDFDVCIEIKGDDISGFCHRIVGIGQEHLPKEMGQK